MQILIIILLAGTLYLLQMFYYYRHWTDGLSTVISYGQTHAAIGDNVKLTITVSNKKRLPLPVLYVKFKTSRTFIYQTEENSTVSDYYYRNDVFSILGNQQVQRTLSFTTTKRGYFTIDTVNLVMNDLFLHTSVGCNLPNHSALYVFPRLLTGREELSLTKALIGDILTKNLHADPLSFRGIRRYTTSDEMRYINWKSSARQQQLMVNTYYDTQTTSVVLIVNFDTHTMIRTEKMRDYVVRLAATLVNAMNRQHFALQLVTNAPDITTGLPAVTEMGAGPEHATVIFETLSRIDITGNISSILEYFDSSRSVFTAKNSGTSYVIVSNYRKEDLLLAYHKQQQEGYSMYFVCPDEPGRFAGNEFYVNHESRADSQKQSHHLPLHNIHLWEVLPHET